MRIILELHLAEEFKVEEFGADYVVGEFQADGIRIEELLTLEVMIKEITVDEVIVW